MATVKDFYQGARPKTLSAALAPVFLGSSIAIAKDEYSIVKIILCFVVSISLQVGVNYANDYQDGVKGTDENRVGPMRLVGSGTASPKSVLTAMWISFFVGAVSGLYLALTTSLYLILVGAACIALAYFYTGTKYAYGYVGLGEVSVFVCFGLVATLGTFYVNTMELNIYVFIASLIPGLYSVAVLLANNIRDIATDKVSGKKTLAVRIGERKSKLLFAGVVWATVIAILIIGFEYNFVFLAIVCAAFPLILTKKISKANNPKQYIDILVLSSKSNLATSVFVSLLIVFS